MWIDLGLALLDEIDDLVHPTLDRWASFSISYTGIHTLLLWANFSTQTRGTANISQPTARVISTTANIRKSGRGSDNGAM